MSQRKRSRNKHRSRKRKNVRKKRTSSTKSKKRTPSAKSKKRTPSASEMKKIMIDFKGLDRILWKNIIRFVLLYGGYKGYKKITEFKKKGVLRLEIARKFIEWNTGFNKELRDKYKLILCDFIYPELTFKNSIQYSDMFVRFGECILRYSTDETLRKEYNKI